MRDFSKLANAIRFLSVDAINQAKSGHPGMPLGMAEIATVLFANHLRFNPKDARWPGRDRFILSNAHGSMLLYSLLYLTGYAGCDIEAIKNFRQLGSEASGHPEYGHFNGAVEMTGGPLGQGFATAVGLAIAEKMKQARISDKSLIQDSKIYVTIGDGCLMEGVSEEALELAGLFNLDNLILLFDDNNITIDGAATLASKTDILARFTASRWNVLSCDGHDFSDIDKAILAAKKSDRPTIIACKTKIGKCCSLEDTSKIHGSPLGDEGREVMAKDLNWSAAPFVVPNDILDEWREIGMQHKNDYDAWQKKFETLSDDDKNLLTASFAGSGNWKDELDTLKKEASAEKPNIASRKSSEMSINKISGHYSGLVGGSADLTGANLTKADDMKAISAVDFSGDYIHYGVREHLMGAVMNGLAIAGFKAFGGTFFSFSDFAKPSIRMSAIMSLPVIYVMTHDSLGSGEDGPTHQGIEQLATMRATPNLITLRPADTIETAESWEIALAQKTRPTVLVLSRQNLKTVTGYRSENLSAKGAYIIQAPSKNERDVTLIATGSEVALAQEVAEKLSTAGKNVAVVSMPSFELFDEQDEKYQREVLGDEKHLRVSIEAASTFGWSKYARLNIGVDEFGLSGKGPEVLAHFGFSADAILQKINELL